jgi:hypothetical protein
MSEWKECSEERFNEMLGVLPPAFWLDRGFLVGEPLDHHKCSVSGQVMPTYAAFVEYKDKFYEGPHLTVQEFTATDAATVGASSHSG